MGKRDDARVFTINGKVVPPDMLTYDDVVYLGIKFLENNLQFPNSKNAMYKNNLPSYKRLKNIIQENGKTFKDYYADINTMNHQQKYIKLNEVWNNYIGSFPFVVNSDLVLYLDNVINIEYKSKILYYVHDNYEYKYCLSYKTLHDVIQNRRPPRIFVYNSEYMVCNLNNYMRLHNYNFFCIRI